MRRKTAKPKTIAIIMVASFAVLTLGIGGIAMLMGPKEQPRSVPAVKAGSHGASVSSEDSSFVSSLSGNASETEQSASGSEIPSEAPEEFPSQWEEPSSSSEPGPALEFPPDGVQTNAGFHVPDKLRGVMLVPGADYLTNPSAGADTVKQEINAALQSVKRLGLNSVILDTKYYQQVVFKSRVLDSIAEDLDYIGYITEQARALDLYVYGIYDVSDAADTTHTYMRASSLDGKTMDTAMLGVADFAADYALDGILLNNYYQTDSGNDYDAYLLSGGGMGFSAYCRQVPKTLLTNAAALIRRISPGTQVGLLSDSVWANAEDNPEGTQTTAAFSALTDGGADTRGLMMEGLFDFVMVKNYGATTDQAVPFGEVAAWWGKQGQSANTAVYIMHASSKIMSQNPGWGAPEQLAAQMIELNKTTGISGSAFDSLPALVKNTGDAVTMVMQYLEGNINEQYILTQLSMSKPAKTEYSTEEPSVTFQGASDPQEKVTINDQPIQTDENGYFSVSMDLEAGDNTFVVKHKNKSVTYQIHRIVEVIKEVQPAGNINVEGGMEVRISALGYEGAQVTASVGGMTATLRQVEDLVDEELRASGYVLYEGFITAPAAAPSAVSLGAITVTGTWQGVSKTLTGGAITVNKLVQAGDGGVVMVIAGQAETFPTNTLNDVSSAAHYPLPKGTIDTIVGQKLVYKNGEKTSEYWKLASGVRVYASDVQAVSASAPGGNGISKAVVSAGGIQTLVKLTTVQKVPYTVTYDGAKIQFHFKYTTSVPNSVEVGANAMFSGGSFSDTTLTLQLKRSGGMMGYTAYYENDTTLVLAFMNATSSLSGARIVVDPGHGGKDMGASGFYPGMDEREINGQIAAKIASALKSRGAQVLVTPQGASLTQRLEQATAFNPHLMISVHGNSSERNPSATGTEVYYFYGMSKPLASTLASQVANALGTSNRGAKHGYYYVTRTSQFASVLLETGFVSNQQEYAKLLNDNYQSRIASAVANSVSAVLGSANTGMNLSGADGTQSPEENVISDPTEERIPLGGREETSVSLDKTSVTLEVGKSEVLKILNTAAAPKWSVRDGDIAQVSQNGTVTAIAPGKTKVAAVVGEKAYYCEVTVTQSGEGGSSDRSESGSGASRTSDLQLTGETTISVDKEGAVRFNRAYDKGEVTWWIESSAVAQIEDSDIQYCVIRGKSAGTTTLFALDGGTNSVIAKTTIIVQ